MPKHPPVSNRVPHLASSTSKRKNEVPTPSAEAPRRFRNGSSSQLVTFPISGEKRSRTPAPEGATIVSNDVRAPLGFLSSASLPWLPAFLAHLLRFRRC